MLPLPEDALCMVRWHTLLPQSLAPYVVPRRKGDTVF